VFWNTTSYLKVIVTNISEDLATSIFRVEIAFLSSTLKIDTRGSSDWVLIIYQSTRCITPEDMHLHPAACACMYGDQGECKFDTFLICIIDINDINTN